MKNNLVKILGIVIGLGALILLIVCLNKTTYTIRVSLIDDRSPDRMLSVYDNKNNKVEFSQIQYVDGNLLCYGYNPSVHFGDIEGVKELNVLLKNNKIVKAKIEEVKE